MSDSRALLCPKCAVVFLHSSQLALCRSFPDAPSELAHLRDLPRRTRKDTSPRRESCDLLEMASREMLFVLRDASLREGFFYESVEVPTVEPPWARADIIRLRQQLRLCRGKGPRFLSVDASSAFAEGNGTNSCFSAFQKRNQSSIRHSFGLQFI